MIEVVFSKNYSAMEVAHIARAVGLPVALLSPAGRPDGGAEGHSVSDALVAHGYLRRVLPGEHDGPFRVVHALERTHPRLCE